MNMDQRALGVSQSTLVATQQVGLAINEVATLLQTVPVRHTEKIWKLEAYHTNQWNRISPKLRAYRNKISEDVQACMAQAGEIYLKNTLTRQPQTYKVASQK